jgi:hypothetical protein
MLHFLFDNMCMLEHLRGLYVIFIYVIWNGLLLVISGFNELLEMETNLHSSIMICTISTLTHKQIRGWFYRNDGDIFHIETCHKSPLAKFYLIYIQHVDCSLFNSFFSFESLTIQFWFYYIVCKGGVLTTTCPWFNNCNSFFIIQPNSLTQHLNTPCLTTQYLLGSPLWLINFKHILWTSFH